MSKIAIISQPDQGVLIDVSGCASLREAIEHLSSTLQVSSQFWKGTNIALNLGQLELNTTQVAQVLAIAKGVGASPTQVFAKSGLTRTALREHNIPLATGEPMALPAIDLDSLMQHELSDEDIEPETSKAQIASKGAVTTAAIYEEASDRIIEQTEDLTEDLTEATDQILQSQTGSSHSESQSESESESQSRCEDESDQQASTDTRFNEIKMVQLPPSPAVPAVLYLRQTLRSGQTVSHAGHLVIIGDVNPGAEIMAEGDITIWGALRGIAHAGIGGNVNAEIRALKLQPIQIRIAHAIARSPDRPRVKYAGGKVGPETGRIVDGRIKISRSTIE
jgi:septum site-determining protein MinC